MDGRISRCRGARGRPLVLTGPVAQWLARCAADPVTAATMGSDSRSRQGEGLVFGSFESKLVQTH